MRKDLRWKASLILILALAFAFVIYPPTGKMVFGGNDPIRLGLDLKGGIELMLEPDYRLSGQDLSVLQNQLLVKLRGASIAEPKVEYLGVQDSNKYNGLVFTFANAADLGRAQNLGVFTAQKLDVATGTKNINFNLKPAGNTLQVEVNEAASDFPDDAMQRSLTIIEHRISEASSHMAEADVRLDPQKGRINVQLPGISSLEKANELITTTGRMTFRLGNQIVMDGTDLKNISAVMQSGKGYVIDFEFQGEGAKKLADITTANVGKQLAIYLDETMLMNPRINQPLTDGKGIIEGNFTKDEAEKDALLMKSGALPISLRVAQSNQVAPTLGVEIIRLSLIACAVGIFLVMVFMLIFYGVPGILADVALVLFAIFLIGIMAVFRGVITLPGIAGIVLTLGVAVDANIIIFERVKDELRNGKRVRPSVDSGFHRAFITIVDCHVTLLITSFVLLMSGNTAIQGFAVSLAIGAVASIFTATFVTKFFLDWRIDHDPDAYAHYFGGKEVLPE